MGTSRNVGKSSDNPRRLFKHNADQFGTEVPRVLTVS
jgi:hypothetical protein